MTVNDLASAVLWGRARIEPTPVRDSWRRASWWLGAFCSRVEGSPNTSLLHGELFSGDGESCRDILLVHTLGTRERVSAER
jgi:hypothetical protein